jgi:hypothetical protein
MGFITMARIDARMNAVRNGQAICNKKERSAASMTAKKIRGPRCSILEDSCVEVPVYSRQTPECAKKSSFGIMVSDADYEVSPTIMDPYNHGWSSTLGLIQWLLHCGRGRGVPQSVEADSG